MVVKCYNSRKLIQLGSKECFRARTMIFGFNTDVHGKDATYHVQTEDRGVKNPVVDSIVYVGGQVGDRVRTPSSPDRETQQDIKSIFPNHQRELVGAFRSGSFRR